MKASPLLAVVLAASSCSSTPDPRPSGFLGDSYADMQLDKDTGSLMYRKAGADIGRYSKVMLDRVEIWIDTENRYRSVSWLDVRRCAELFGDAMRAALEDGYPIVAAPATDVLRIRLAVTGVQADVDGYSTRENLGYGDPDTVDAVSATGTRLDIESISVEADFVDSSTGERLVAALVRRSAHPSRGESSWQSVEEVLRDLAQQVRSRLDRARAGR